MTKEVILRLLPEKIIQTVNQYDAFTAEPPPVEAKAFIQYQQAAKSALAHLLLLLKLETCLQSENQTPSVPQDWIQAARQALDEENDESDFD